jgi:hypothetical protein
MYGFGADEGIEPQSQDEQGPKWFRDHMAKVSEDLKALRAENESLRAEKAEAEVTKTLTAQGYAPQAAGLFQGKPEELDDWLGTFGAALAKAAPAAEGEEQAFPQGTPQTVVSPESQAAAAAFAAAGTDGASPALAGDDALAARLAAAKDQDEFNTILRENGSRYV